MKKYIYIAFVIVCIFFITLSLRKGFFENNAREYNVNDYPGRLASSSSGRDNTKLSPQSNNVTSKGNSLGGVNLIFQKNPASLGDFFANPEYKGVLQDDMLALMDLHKYENEKLLEAVLSLKSMSDKLSVCQDFFKKIAGENPTEAFTLAMKLPPGTLRNEAFLGIGQSVTGVELASLLTQLYIDNNSADFNKLAGTIQNNLSRYSIEDVEALSRIDLPIDLQRTLCSIYGDNLVNKLGADSAFQRALRSASDHGQNPLIGVLRAGASLSEGQEWFLNKLNSNEVAINEEVQKLVISNVLPAIQVNPVEKLDWINRIENKNLRELTLREYVYCWMQSYPDDVSTWVNSQPESDYKDMLINNIVKYYRAYKQYEIAKQWQEKINDANLKSSLNIVEPTK